MDLFLELIRISLTDKSELPRIFDTKEWQRAFRMSVKQSVAGVVFEGIKRLPAEQRPDRDLLMQWITTYENIRHQNMLLNKRASTLCRILKKDGWRCCVLKGQGLALLYPDPLERTSGDIDVWMDGGRKNILKYVRPTGKDTEVLYHHTDYHIFDDVEVETHFTPSWMNAYFNNRRLQRWFASMAERQFNHLVKLPDNEGAIYIPTTEFNRVYILIHIYRHFFSEGIGLRQLVDYFYVLRQPVSNEIRTETFTTLKMLGMMRFAAAVMYIMNSVFGLEDSSLVTEPNANDGRLLLGEVMRAGNFGKYDDRRRVPRNRFEKLWLWSCRSIKYITKFPEEVLWGPVFKAWQFGWRTKNGYL